MNTVNFMDDRLFYLTSKCSHPKRNKTCKTFFPLGYYNGILADIDEDSIHSSGQCEAEGIKLILAIGEVPYNPVLYSDEVPGAGSE